MVWEATRIGGGNSSAGQREAVKGGGGWGVVSVNVALSGYEVQRTPQSRVGMFVLTHPHAYTWCCCTRGRLYLGMCCSAQPSVCTAPSDSGSWNLSMWPPSFRILEHP